MHKLLIIGDFVDVDRRDGSVAEACVTETTMLGTPYPQ